MRGGVLLYKVVDAEGKGEAFVGVFAGGVCVMVCVCVADG